MKKIINDYDFFAFSCELKNLLAVTKGYLSLLDGSIEKYNKYMPYVIESLNRSIELLQKINK